MFEYIERFTAVLVAAGMPPMPSRVFVALLVADEGLTAAEIAGTLRVSAAVVSGGVRYLTPLGLVLRERIPGSRRDRYRVSGDVWSVMLRMREQVMNRWAAAAAEMDDLLKRWENGSPPGHEVRVREPTAGARPGPAQPSPGRVCWVQRCTHSFVYDAALSMITTAVRGGQRGRRGMHRTRKTVRPVRVTAFGTDSHFADPVAIHPFTRRSSSFSFVQARTIDSCSRGKEFQMGGVMTSDASRARDNENTAPQQRDPIDLSQRTMPTGEVVVTVSGHLGQKSAALMCHYMEHIIAPGHPVTVRLRKATCDASGVTALATAANLAARAGCPFQINGPATLLLLIAALADSGDITTHWFRDATLVWPVPVDVRRLPGVQHGDDGETTTRVAS